MTLSVCLIVKNEEPVLARCLSCATQIADELIVVDTGSTDRSVEIAKQFTPKVYLHPWQDSFAEARNYAYSKATCDYMMWLDADDVISDENIARFLKLKQTMPEDTDVVFTLYRTPVEDGIGTYILRDRIIRRSLDPKCRGDAHEAIPIQSAWKRLYATDITIFHKKEYVNDPDRNMNIFKKVLREQLPMNAFDKANYCKELFVAGEHEKAYEVFLEYKPCCSAAVYHYGFFFVVLSLLSLKRYETCIRELEELERNIPTTANMVYWQGFCHEALGEKEKAEQCYLRAMTIPEDPTTLYIQYTGYTDYFPLLGLARIEAKRGNKEKAREYIEKAAALYPLNPEWKKAKVECMFLLSTAERRMTVPEEKLEKMKEELEDIRREVAELSGEDLEYLVSALSGTDDGAGRGARQVKAGGDTGTAALLPYYDQRIAVVGKTETFRKVREQYVEEFSKYGFTARGFTEMDEIGPSGYQPTCCVVIAPYLYPVPRDRSVIWVAIQTEQIYCPVLGGSRHGKYRLDEFLSYAKGYDVIFDFQEATAKYLAELSGKKVLYCPLTVKKQESFLANPYEEEEKNYDLCFVGLLGGQAFPKRDVIIDHLRKRYAVYPYCENLWGEKRDRAIRSSRICLNIHYEESLGREGGRLKQYFENGAFVLSERMYDPYPYVEGEDFASFYLTDLCERIDYYLEHEEERKRIARSAYNKVRSLSYDERYKCILDAILLEADERRAEAEMARSQVLKIWEAAHGAEG